MGVHDASRSAVLDLSGDGAGLDEHASIATASTNFYLHWERRSTGLDWPAWNDRQARGTAGGTGEWQSSDSVASVRKA
jgi:hypothetical protein